MRGPRLFAPNLSECETRPIETLLAIPLRGGRTKEKMDHPLMALTRPPPVDQSFQRPFLHQCRDLQLSVDVRVQCVPCSHQRCRPSEARTIVVFTESDAK